MGETIIPNIDYNEISKLILSKEKEILDNTPIPTGDGDTGLGPASITSRFKNYNVWTWQHPELNKLKLEVQLEYKKFIQKLGVPRQRIYIQCWANILRTGESIKPHIHATHEYTYLGGHICIKCDKTSTMYMNPLDQLSNAPPWESKNEVGKLTIFPDYLPHFTTINNSLEERITIAFDLKLEMDSTIDNDNNKVLFDDAK